MFKSFVCGFTGTITALAICGIFVSVRQKLDSIEQGVEYLIKTTE